MVKKKFVVVVIWKFFDVVEIWMCELFEMCFNEYDRFFS